MAGFTASWVHGNAVVAQSSDLFSFEKYGWGTQIVMRPGQSCWFHIPVPTPEILDGARMQLIRAFIQLRFEGPGGILDELHLWDGDRRVATDTDLKAAIDADVKLPGCRTFEFYQPWVCQFGVGLSFKLAAMTKESAVYTRRDQKPTFVIGSAGAHFERVSRLREAIPRVPRLG